MRALVLSSLCLCMAAGDLPVRAPIVRVRVHPDEAWVSRVAKVSLPQAGTYRVRVEGLPTGLSLDDVRASLRGAEGLRLGNVALASDPRNPTPSEPLKKLEAELKELNRQSSSLSARTMALDEARTLLEEVLAKELPGTERALYMPATPQALLELCRRVQAEDEAMAERGRLLERESAKLSEKISRMEKALERLRNQEQAAPVSATVELSALAAGTVELELLTRTKEARWKPAYEVHLSADRKDLELACYAQVSQLSGEDWKGVEVEIANAQPSRNLNAPRPRPVVALGYRAPEPPPPKSVPAQAAPAKAYDAPSYLSGIGSLSGLITDDKGAPIAGATVMLISGQVTRTALTGGDGSFSLGLLNAGSWAARVSKDGFQTVTQRIDIMPNQNRFFSPKLAPLGSTTVVITSSVSPEDEEPPAPALEYAPSHIEEGAGLSRAYSLEGRRDILSDAQPCRLLVTRAHLTPEIQLQCRPTLSPEVFELAQVKPEAQFPWFPSSPVAVFREGERLGVEALPGLDPGHPVQFSFGPLPGVQILRQVIEARTESAGAFGHDRAWILRTRYQATNEGSAPRRVGVQVPTLRSSSGQIKVEALAESTPGTEDKQGRKAWFLEIPAKGSAVLEDDLRIRAPQGGHIPELGSLGLPDSD